jgi:molybdopterin synthase catalytic subunit
VSDELGTQVDAEAAVRLVAVRDVPLSVDEVLAAVQDPSAGGTCVFVGAVRDSDHERSVDALSYSAHPSVVDRLRGVAVEVAGRHPVTALAAVHRVGELVIGDLAVVVAVSAPHRGEAFDACRDLIDTLKSTVPIWKHQDFSDGSQEWVGLP